MKALIGLAWELQGQITLQDHESRIAVKILALEAALMTEGRAELQGQMDLYRGKCQRTTDFKYLALEGAVCGKGTGGWWWCAGPLGAPRTIAPDPSPC